MWKTICTFSQWRKRRSVTEIEWLLSQSEERGCCCSIKKMDVTAGCSPGVRVSSWSQHTSTLRIPSPRSLQEATSLPSWRWNSSPIILSSPPAVLSTASGHLPRRVCQKSAAAKRGSPVGGLHPLPPSVFSVCLSLHPPADLTFSDWAPHSASRISPRCVRTLVAYPCSAIRWCCFPLLASSHHNRYEL